MKLFLPRIEVDSSFMSWLWRLLQSTSGRIKHGTSLFIFITENLLIVKGRERGGFCKFRGSVLIHVKFMLFYCIVCSEKIPQDSQEETATGEIFTQDKTENTVNAYRITSHLTFFLNKKKLRKSKSLYFYYITYHHQSTIAPKAAFNSFSTNISYP